MTFGRRPSLILLCLASLPWAAGCYASRAATADSLVPGSDVILILTDRARPALAGQLGAHAYRITGKLTSRTDSSLALNVESVEYVGGAVSPWNGSPMTLATDHVGVATERRISAPRTATFIGSLVAAVVAAFVTLDLSGKGSTGNPDNGGGVVNP